MHSTLIVILFKTQSHKMAIQTSVLDQNYNENKDSIHTLSMRDIITLCSVILKFCSEKTNGDNSYLTAQNESY